MISGKLALGGLSLEFGNQQKRFDQLSSKVDELTKKQAELVREQREIIEELARLYLPELSPEAVSAGLAELELKMRSALTRQAAHRAELEQRLAELPEDVARRELLVAEAEGAEERAARALDETRRAVEQELTEDGTHARNVTEHRDVMERRSILKARGSRLQTVANVERHRYEANKAFEYLHRREYGQPGYRGRFLARWLDGWLARRIDYTTLEHNYRVLRTGPHAIRAEIRALTERAEELETEIDRQETEAGERLGLLAALEADESAQRSLVDARAALQDVRARHDRIAAEIRAVDANRGRPYEEAIDEHRAFLEDRSVQELLSIARSTPDPKDDALVSRLDEVRARIERIGRELPQHRQDLEKRATETTSLAELARKAAAHFASRRSHFSEEFNLERLVRSVFDDGTPPEEVLERIQRSHITEPVLVPSTGRRDLDGWFADLSSRFDPELGAVSVRVDEGPGIDSEVVVYDHRGRVLHRRVTRRSGDG